MPNGEPPFQSSTVVSLVRSLDAGAARAGQLNPELPPALEALILQLLSKKPEDRIQTR